MLIIRKLWRQNVFEPKEVVKLDNNKTAKVISFLGEGGQGEVYLVEVDVTKYALKWYKEKPSDVFVYNLKKNIEKGSPSASVLWPLMLTKTINGSIGYLVDLRPQAYKSFVSYLIGNASFNCLEAQLNWCIKLAQAFKKLHENGFSYQDLNDGSFFFDENSGDALICDNDNVTATGENLGILGKMKYMSPEILMQKNIPDVHSDRFSLAVILFMCLTLGHPFEGERLKKYNFVDEIAESEIYGAKAVYIYSETDKSNRPIRGYHTSVIRKYPYLPEYIKDAFLKTFGDGLNDRENSRTTELEWVRLLSGYRDEIITCKSCGFKYALGINNNLIKKCPKCSAVNEAPILVVGNNKITIEVNKKIHETSIKKIFVRIQQNCFGSCAKQQNPALLGLKNYLFDDVTICDASGKEKNITINGVIPRVKDLSIIFKNNIKEEIK